jgi:hypothetical protein
VFFPSHQPTVWSMEASSNTQGWLQSANTVEPTQGNFRHINGDSYDLPYPMVNYISSISTSFGMVIFYFQIPHST